MKKLGGYAIGIMVFGLLIWLCQDPGWEWWVGGVIQLVFVLGVAILFISALAEGGGGSKEDHWSDRGRPD